MNPGTLDLVVGILTAINTIIIAEYLNFRFGLAEKFVLKKDYDGVIGKIFEKLDKILEKLENKADKNGKNDN